MFERKLPARGVRVLSRVSIGILIIGGLLSLPATAIAQGPPEVLPGNGRVVLEGELEVLYEDHDDEARLHHVLHSDNRRIPLRFPEGYAPDLVGGSRVRVVGDLAEGSVTTTSVSTLAVSTSRTMGAQDVLVILFNFSNNQSQPFAASTVASINDQVRNYYLENTYGQTLLNFTVAGWFTISSNDTSCDYTNWASQAESAASKAGFNLNAYDRRVFAFPRASGCSWNGMGNLAGPRSWANGNYSVRTIAHEQGHNFGDHHSKASHCASGSCSTVEYGDDRDVMGVGGTVAHMNAFQKERLGWLNYGSSPGIQTVSTSGDYWIDNYETLGGGTKALKIWNAAKNAYYYIESRAQVGFDNYIAPGVTVHLGISGISYQVDLDPNTYMFDSALDVGHVFTDPAIGLSFQTVSTSVDGALIRVSLTTAPCTTQAPTLSLTAAGGMNYTATLRNNNGSTCAASVFSLSSAVPSGWAAAFSPASSASLAPGASASATVTLTAPAGTTGSYSFSVTGTDTSSGQSASASASVALSSVPAVTSLEVSASAAVTGNGGNRSASIAVTVKAGGQALAGAAVSVVVTNPQGGRSTLTGTTASNGTATVKFGIKPKDPSGNYQVQATANGSGASGSAVTSFLVP